LLSRISGMCGRPIKMAPDPFRTLRKYCSPGGGLPSPCAPPSLVDDDKGVSWQAGRGLTIEEYRKESEDGPGYEISSLAVVPGHQVVFRNVPKESSVAFFQEIVREREAQTKGSDFVTQARSLILRQEWAEAEDIIEKAKKCFVEAKGFGVHGLAMMAEVEAKLAAQKSAHEPSSSVAVYQHQQQPPSPHPPLLEKPKEKTADNNHTNKHEQQQRETTFDSPKPRGPRGRPPNPTHGSKKRKVFQ